MASQVRSHGARLFLIGVAAAAAGCAASDSSVLNAASPVEREFAIAAVTWDLNKDGDVTCDEWKQYAAGLFREADRNRDSLLSKEEFAGMAKQDRLFESIGFSYFDSNGDGRLTSPELTDKPNPAFALLDKNRDCVLAPDERVRHAAPSSSETSEAAKPPPSGRRR